MSASKSKLKTDIFAKVFADLQWEVPDPHALDGFPFPYDDPRITTIFEDGSVRIYESAKRFDGVIGAVAAKLFIAHIETCLRLLPHVHTYVLFLDKSEFVTSQKGFVHAKRKRKRDEALQGHTYFHNNAPVIEAERLVPSWSQILAQPSVKGRAIRDLMYLCQQFIVVPEGKRVIFDYSTRVHPQTGLMYPIVVTHDSAQYMLDGNMMGEGDNAFGYYAVRARTNQPGYRAGGILVRSIDTDLLASNLTHVAICRPEHVVILDLKNKARRPATHQMFDINTLAARVASMYQTRNKRCAILSFCVMCAVSGNDFVNEDVSLKYMSKMHLFNAFQCMAAANILLVDMCDTWRPLILPSAFVTFIKTAYLFKYGIVSKVDALYPMYSKELVDHHSLHKVKYPHCFPNLNHMHKLLERCQFTLEYNAVTFLTAGKLDVATDLFAFYEYLG